MNRNGDRLGRLSEVDVLRAEVAHLGATGEKICHALAKEEQSKALVTQLLCAVLHKQGLEVFQLEPDDLERCRDHNAFRVRLDWHTREDGDRDCVLSLLELNDEEKVALAKALKKPPKIIEPSGE